MIMETAQTVIDVFVVAGLVLYAMVVCSLWGK